MNPFFSHLVQKDQLINRGNTTKKGTVSQKKNVKADNNRLKAFMNGTNCSLVYLL